MTQQVRNKANDRKAASLQLKPRAANKHGYGKNYEIKSRFDALHTLDKGDMVAMIVAKKDVRSK